MRVPGGFQDEITGLPPTPELDFMIELLPGIAPISKAPHRMVLAKLKELKNQLEDLLDKGLPRCCL